MLRASECHIEGMVAFLVFSGDLVYGTLVFKLVSGVWGFKSGFQVGCPVLVRHDLFGRSADFWGNQYTGVISVSHFAIRFSPGPDFG